MLTIIKFSKVKILLIKYFRIKICIYNFKKIKAVTLKATTFTIDSKSMLYFILDFFQLFPH